MVKELHFAGVAIKLQIKRVSARCAAELAVQVCDIYVVQTCTAIPPWRCVPLCQNSSLFCQFSCSYRRRRRQTHDGRCRQTEMNDVNGSRFIHRLVGDDQP